MPMKQHTMIPKVSMRCAMLFPGRVYPAQTCFEATNFIGEKPPRIDRSTLRPVGGTRGFLGTCVTRHDSRSRTLRDERPCSQLSTPCLLPNYLVAPGTNPPQSAPSQRITYEFSPCPARTHARRAVFFPALSSPVPPICPATPAIPTHRRSPAPPRPIAPCSPVGVH
jgi:hypothetical protein